MADEPRDLNSVNKNTRSIVKPSVSRPVAFLIHFFSFFLFFFFFYFHDASPVCYTPSTADVYSNGKHRGKIGLSIHQFDPVSSEITGVFTLTPERKKKIIIKGENQKKKGSRKGNKTAGSEAYCWLLIRTRSNEAANWITTNGIRDFYPRFIR